MSTWTKENKQSEFTATNQTKTSPSWSLSDFLGLLLQENGAYLLQENGSKLIIGTRQSNIPSYTNQAKN